MEHLKGKWTSHMTLEKSEPFNSEEFDQPVGNFGEKVLTTIRNCVTVLNALQDKTLPNLTCE